MDFGLNSMSQTLISQALLRAGAKPDQLYMGRDTGVFNTILAGKATKDTAEFSMDPGNAAWGKVC